MRLRLNAPSSWRGAGQAGGQPSGRISCCQGKSVVPTACLCSLLPAARAVFSLWRLLLIYFVHRLFRNLRGKPPSGLTLRPGDLTVAPSRGLGTGSVSVGVGFPPFTPRGSSAADRVPGGRGRCLRIRAGPRALLTLALSPSLPGGAWEMSQLHRLPFDGNRPRCVSPLCLVGLTELLGLVGLSPSSHLRISGDHLFFAPSSGPQSSDGLRLLCW